jgi:hypothetical protein
MNLSLANRYFAMCGILGLVLTIANFIGTIAFDESTATHYLSYIAWIFLLLGLLGTYLSQVEELGVFGFIGFLTIIIATAWIIGMVAVHVFGFPVIQGLDPSLVSNDMLETDFPSPIREAEMTSSYLFMAGPGLYGLSILLKSRTTRWPGVLLVLIGISSVLDSQFEILGLIGYLGFPIAVFWMCVKVLQVTRSTVISLTTTP